MKITIDGPVASGKTAVGRALARRIAARFLDTGTMYRAATWAALQRNLDFSNADSLAKLVQSLSIEVILEDGEHVLKVNGADITDFLRDPDVEANVSQLSQVRQVRHELVNQQRTIADNGNIVVAGRDIGTVVIPDANLKIYLDASIDIRARRRHDEMRRKGNIANLGKLIEDIKTRDTMDSKRDESPLVAASDALIINTDRLRIDQIVTRIMQSMEQK